MRAACTDKVKFRALIFSNPIVISTYVEINSNDPIWAGVLTNIEPIELKIIVNEL